MTEFLQSLEIEGIYLLRILVAGLCSILVGRERSKRLKEAGIRTHFIVAAASALMMVISITFVGNEARIAAQIVSGIGFLGAGMIFFRRENLHGLTTAAGIWATAGIGMAAGAGLYLVAVGATFLVFIAQEIFHTRYFSKKSQLHLLLVKFEYTSETVNLLKQYFGVTTFARFKAFEDGDKVVAEAVIRTSNDCGPDSLATVLIAHHDIHYIERLEDI